MFAKVLSKVARPAARVFTNNKRFVTRAAFATGVTTGALMLPSATVFADSNDVDYSAVSKAIASVLDADDYDDGSLGPVFIRLAWHTSGTYDKNDGSGGSTGGTIRFEPEAGHGANAGLNVARDLLEPIKARFPNITYADLYTLAGKVAVEEMGGPEVAWRPGRKEEFDNSNCTADGRLPDAALGAQHLRDIFHRMGFNDREIVALSGAHTFGRCHTDRSGFDGPWTRAPTTFSNLYYQELIDNTWTERKWRGPKQFTDPTGDLMMLPTDISLTTDPEFRTWTEVYAKDEALFAKDFSAAFSKLMELGVDFPANNTTPKVLIGALLGLAAAGGAWGLK
jgi:cytochrome c peroxidase